MAEKNYTNIRFADLRKKIEGDYNEQHDALTECYYKYWRHGKSKPFETGNFKYDLISDKDGKPDLISTKALFNKLHGLLSLELDKIFYEENEKEAVKIDAEKHGIDLDATKLKISDLEKENIKVTLSAKAVK